MNIYQYQSITPIHLTTINKIKLFRNRYRQVHRIGGVVGELRSTLCTKTPLYVRSGSCTKQMPLEHLSYIEQMSLEHLSYIKETSWNTSEHFVLKAERSSPKVDGGDLKRIIQNRLYEFSEKMSCHKELLLCTYTAQISMYVIFVFSICTDKYNH